MTEREKRLVTAARIIVATADSANPLEETEGDVIAANWDILGPRFRAAVSDYFDCPNFPL